MMPARRMGVRRGARPGASPDRSRMVTAAAMSASKYMKRRMSRPPVLTRLIVTQMGERDHPMMAARRSRESAHVGPLVLLMTVTTLSWRGRKTDEKATP